MTACPQARFQGHCTKAGFGHQDGSPFASSLYGKTLHSDNQTDDNDLEAIFHCCHQRLWNGTAGCRSELSFAPGTLPPYVAHLVSRGSAEETSTQSGISIKRAGSDRRQAPEVTKSSMSKIERLIRIVAWSAVIVFFFFFFFFFYNNRRS